MCVCARACGKSACATHRLRLCSHVRKRCPFPLFTHTRTHTTVCVFRLSLARGLPCIPCPPSPPAPAPRPSAAAAGLPVARARAGRCHHVLRAKRAATEAEAFSTVRRARAGARPRRTRGASDGGRRRRKTNGGRAAASGGGGARAERWRTWQLIARRQHSLGAGSRAPRALWRVITIVQSTALPAAETAESGELVRSGR